jgi:phosphonate transport system ATP-binding protein
MIELSDVCVIYPNGQVALQGCSLTFLRGQFTVLLGSSGAGKSTLLHCVNLLLRPTRGTVRSEDLGVLRDRRIVRTHRRRTGMVFQQHHLLSRHSALQNVLMARLGYHRVWRTIFPLSERERRFALECLDRVGLLHKSLERVENLSGGERQRVGIARALAQAPRLILADEPVASLDPTTAHKILGLLHRVCREDGITAVVSLHQVDLARTYADRIIGLNQGRVVFDGPPDRLLAEAQSALYSPLPIDHAKESSGNGPAPSLVPTFVPGSES